MGTPDSEHERMSARYAQMEDGELEALAAEPDSLTDVARDVLRTELERRGIPVDWPDVEEKAPPLIQETLITCRQFRDLHEALFAKSTLDSAGIESWLLDDNMVRTDWFISNLLGGVKLRVREADLDAATGILNEAPLERYEVEGVGEYEQPRCPACQSVDIIYEGLNKGVAYTSAWLGVPVPLAQNQWKCESCGKTWREEADA